MMGEYPALSPEDIEVIAERAQKTHFDPRVVPDTFVIEYLAT